LTIRRDLRRLLERLARFVFDPLVAGQLPGTMDIDIAGTMTGSD
jgi:hypothetical protein